MNRPTINLVIPDVHVKLRKVELILSRESFDKAYFLGDFFDDYHDTPSQNAVVAKRLNELMLRDDLEFIIGNHDAHYLWPVPMIQCSGYESDKYRAIDETLDKELFFKKFKFHHVVDKWLLTHAGLHPSYLPNSLDRTPEAIDEWLKIETIACHKALRTFKKHWFFNAGMTRGGRCAFGGIEWCDFFGEFDKIHGVKQIVGHTFCALDGRTLEPKWFDENNLNLDTNLNHYAIIVDGQVEIKKVLDLT